MMSCVLDPFQTSLPFENFLQYLKKLLRKGNQALQQIVKRYKEMYFGPWFLSCRVPNNCVYLADASVIVIENIIRNGHEDFIVGRKFSNKSNLFSFPLSSSSYDIFRVSELSDSLEAFPLNNVKCKALKLPNFEGSGVVMDGTYAVFPILMEENR